MRQDFKLNYNANMKYKLEVSHIKRRQNVEKLLPATGAIGLTALVRFPGISFCFLMYYLLPYVLMSLHSVHSVLLLLILYSVLLMYYCLRIVNFLCRTATGHRPNCSW
jgi:hypothetical protein